jgi:hypothetical protein
VNKNISVEIIWLYCLTLQILQISRRNIAAYIHAWCANIEYLARV